jgi:hypothetical protein
MMAATRLAVSATEELAIRRRCLISRRFFR